MRYFVKIGERAYRAPVSEERAQRIYSAIKKRHPKFTKVNMGRGFFIYVNGNWAYFARFIKVGAENDI